MTVDALLAKAFDLLIHPESTTAWICVGLFAVCFVCGLVGIARCLAPLRKLDRLTREPSSIESRYCNIEQLRKEANAKVPAIEAKVYLVPSYLFTIGNWGTVFGLGVHIRDLAEVLKSDTIDIDQVMPVIGVIACKFQIFVWGGLLALVFRCVVLQLYRSAKGKLSADIPCRCF